NDDFNVHHRITSLNTVIEGFADTFFDRGNEFARNSTADHFVFENETTTRRQGFHFQPNVTVLTTTAGLLDVLAFDFDLLAERFFVGHLRLTDVRFDFKLAKDTINDNFEMELAHP